jgi:hypothetical protein
MFLAEEGIAINWIKSYPQNVIVCPNAKSLVGDLSSIGIETMYLPNIYYPKQTPVTSRERVLEDKPHVDIGCFGAMRTLKNHFSQAVAAISFGNAINKSIRLHVNASELGDSNILKNIESLFHGSRHSLVIHKWSSHDEFIKLVRTMDIGMQISLSESFNIVAADFVHNRTPIIVSDEISWLPGSVSVPVNAKTPTIVKRMKYIYNYFYPSLDNACVRALEMYNNNAMSIWWQLGKKLARK